MTNKFILDTGPLLLFTAGLFNKNYVPKINYKERTFQEVDFDLLAQFLRDSNVLVSPQILGELCNVAQRSLGRALFQKYMEAINFFLRDGLIEIYTKKEDLLNISSIAKFGFSDMSIVAMSDEGTLIIDEWPLFNYCQTNEKEVEYLDTILAPKHHLVR